jgi:hypothetical protein
MYGVKGKLANQSNPEETIFSRLKLFLKIVKPSGSVSYFFLNDIKKRQTQIAVKEHEILCLQSIKHTLLIHNLISVIDLRSSNERPRLGLEFLNI